MYFNLIFIAWNLSFALSAAGGGHTHAVSNVDYRKTRKIIHG